MSRKSRFIIGALVVIGLLTAGSLAIVRALGTDIYSYSTCAFGETGHDAVALLSGRGAAQVCSTSENHTYDYEPRPYIVPRNTTVTCSLKRKDITLTVYDSGMQIFGDDICRSAFAAGWRRVTP